MSVDLQNLKEGTREQIIKDIRKDEHTGLNLFLQSSRDLEIILFIKKPWDFYNFYEDFIQKYGKFFRRKGLSIITRKIYFGHRYIHKDNNNTLVLGGTMKKEFIDEKDEKMINILVNQPKISLLDLSKKMGVASSSGLSRLKKLIRKKIIKGYGLVLDKAMLGYSSYRVEILLNDPSRKKEVVDYLSLNWKITKINEFVGENDLDFEIDVKTTHELDSFLEKLRLDLPQIRDYEVINIIED
jgi:DNA-binding Lrp family transcriptional regulator